MYTLNDTQIDYILDDIRRRGVEMEDLQSNLLDHICCIIEQNLEENGDFGDFYKKTIQRFFKHELWEIEEETLLLLTFKNYYTMKKTMIISGAVSAALTSIGIIFKFMHWPGASASIVLGVACSSFIFLPILFTLKAKEKQNTRDKMIVGLATGLGILISLSILFKVMHWPGANMMALIFLLGMIAVFIPMYFFTGIRNPETKVNTIASSVIMIMGTGLFLTLVNARPAIQDRAMIVSDTYLQDTYLKFSSEREGTKMASKDSAMPSPELVQKCDRVCTIIEQLKLKLVNATMGSHYTSIDYSDLGRLDNYDIPTLMLFGGEKEAGATPELLGLKNDLKALNDLLTRGKSSGPFIDLTDKTDAVGMRMPWEMNLFYHVPLGNILRNLTQLQLNVRFMQLKATH